LEGFRRDRSWVVGAFAVHMNRQVAGRGDIARQIHRDPGITTWPLSGNLVLLNDRLLAKAPRGVGWARSRLTAGRDLARQMFAAGGGVRSSAGADHRIDKIAIICYTTSPDGPTAGIGIGRVPERPKGVWGSSTQG
jgi:hypothetical protein